MGKELINLSKNLLAEGNFPLCRSRKESPMKKPSLSTIILILMLVVGLFLLLYPSFADYWNSFTQTKAITSYAEQVAQLDNEEYDHIWQEAYDYNASLINRHNSYLLSDEQQVQYQKLLNLGGNGIMGKRQTCI